MSTWVVGDIHGCAEELAELLVKMQFGSNDYLICVGDLYHRGPDPLGVARVLASVGNLEVVLGNHERVLLERAAQAIELGRALTQADLAGDGGTPMAPVSPDEAKEIMAVIQNRPYFARGMHAGQPWVVVHAGIIPGAHLEQTDPYHLTRLRRIQEMPGQPYWYEFWQGPELVLFGHTPGKLPRTRFAGGRLVALGLDTGCVYGGSLTAYCIEDGEMEVVQAKQKYV